VGELAGMQQARTGVRCAIQARIDFGVMLLRLVLWVKYSALYSSSSGTCFSQTLARIETYIGIRAFLKYALFTVAVNPADGIV